MILILVFALLFLFLFLLMIVTPVEISFQFKRKEKRHDIHLKITVWYVFYKTFHIPVIGFEEETKSVVIKEKSEATIGEDTEKDIKETPEEIISQMDALRMWVNHIHGMLPILKKMLKKIKIKELEWQTSIGTGEAAWTGMLSGTLWSVKNMVAGILSTVMQLKCSPRFAIEPQFQKAVFDTSFSCMLSVRLGHTIIAGIRLMKHLRGSAWKLWKKSKEKTNSNKEAS